MTLEKIRYYDRKEKEYPKKLSDISDSPERLYVLGRLPDENRPCAAIVGARNATPYGRTMARKFAGLFAANGIQIVSGFARGIDRAAYEGALEAGGSTFAVLGNGVDVCYPRENIDLYEKVRESGGFLSEFEPKTQPRAWFFPKRNRMISALADKVLVVEAGEKSGALITAEFGLEQGKDVYAVPGRIGDELSSGCNRLIAQGAYVAVSPEEMLKDFELDVENFKRFHEKKQLGLAQEEETVYSCIRFHPKHINEILKDSKMGLPLLVSILLQLELKNLIEEVTKNYYIRL